MKNELYTQVQVIAAHPQYKRLINAAIKGLNIDENDIDACRICDVTEHGMQSGFGSFIYYSDTHPFAMKYRSLIVKLLEEQADELGEEVVSMVSGFNQFRNEPIDNDTRKDLYKYIGGGKLTIENNITNLMCWFAVEEVCKWFIKED